MLHWIFKAIIFLLLCACLWWCKITDDLANKTIPSFLIHDLKNTSWPTKVLQDQEILYYDIPNTEDSAHASAIVDISNVSNKNLMLLYFAGSREGARDVGIYQSFFSSNANSMQGSWSESKRILDAPSLSSLSGKFIKKLGNPVSFVDAQGRTHLFVVGVSMGGWATSKIYHLMFDRHNLNNLHYLEELHLSPFLNFSHLVRTPAILKDDGGFVLPIYHEFARKYPILLDFDKTLKITSMTLPIKLTSLLQPSFVPLSIDKSIGVYRNNKLHESILYVSECKNFCIHKPSNLYNYDFSSVLFNALDSIFLLHNLSQRHEGNKREELWLYMLSKQSLEKERVLFMPLLRLDTLLDNEVSYPSVALSGDFVSIAYTYGRKNIRVAFVSKSMLSTLMEQYTKGML